MVVLWVHTDLICGDARVDHITHLQHTQTVKQMIILCDYSGNSDLGGYMIFAIIRRRDHCVMMVRVVGS